MSYMKVLISILVFLAFDVSASQCTRQQYNKNTLVNSVLSFSDSSPFFLTNEIYSYKAGIWDIDTNDYSVNSFGNKLTITGNTWKMVKLESDYTITPNSVLEFEFRSAKDEAEINGIGLIMYGATGFHGDRFFQVHGTESPASFNQDYHNYSGKKWMKYQIPLWNSASNTTEKRVQLLVFAGDDDNAQVNQKANYSRPG